MPSRLEGPMFIWIYWHLIKLTQNKCCFQNKYRNCMECDLKLAVPEEDKRKTELVK